MANKDELLALIKKEISGEDLSIEEQATLKKWIKKSPRNEQTYLSCTAESAIEQFIVQSREIDQGSDWTELETKLPTLLNTKAWSSSLLQWTLLAACFLLFVVGGVYHFSAKKKSAPLYKNLTDVSISKNHLPSIGHAAIYFENGGYVDDDSILPNKIYNGYRLLKDSVGQIDISPVSGFSISRFIEVACGSEKGIVCLFPDRSRVILQPSSTMIFYNDINSSNRNFQLFGDAFFDIQQYSGKKLNIGLCGKTGETDKMKLALTTGQLAISSSSIDSTPCARIFSGLVDCQAPDMEKITLSPGYEYSLNYNIHHNSTHPIDKGLTGDCVQDEFNFQQMPIKTVLAKIAKWYKVKIEITAAIQDIQVMTRFQKDQNLESILSILELGGAFHSVRKGNGYTLIPNS